MSTDFDYLYKYLQKERIYINEKEFEFQLQSHPDYPSLLSITDTLTFFNINNGAINVGSSEIELLPDRFVTFFREKQKKPQLLLIEKKGNDYFQTKEKETLRLSLSELEDKWGGVVLIAEKPEFEHTKSTNKLSWVLPLSLSIIFIVFLFQCEANLQTKLFFLFPILGILFSIAAIKDLFGIRNEFLNNFCSMTNATSCNSVVGSKKWRIFEIVNFSDLSVVFFTSQILGLLVFLFSGNTTVYFTIQKLLLIVSIPVLLLSVYYQNFIEKKWCPICLVIIAVIVLEIGYLIAFQSTVFMILTKEVIVFGFIFLSLMSIWSALKKLLNKQKELKEFQLNAIRFERNYALFKNSLIAKEKVQLPQGSIILGNDKSDTKITIISNPFCGHCKEAHEVLETILEKHHNDIQIQVILNVNLASENDEGKKLFRSLMRIYEVVGEIAFVKALKNWFDKKNLSEWYDLNSASNTIEFDAIFNAHNKWCGENNYNFTPAIFINGYEYPQFFDRKKLLFYINDLIEDHF